MKTRNIVSCVEKEKLQNFDRCVCYLFIKMVFKKMLIFFCMSLRTLHKVHRGQNAMVVTGILWLVPLHFLFLIPPQTYVCILLFQLPGFIMHYCFAKSKLILGQMISTLNKDRNGVLVRFTALSKV